MASSRVWIAEVDAAEGEGEWMLEGEGEVGRGMLEGADSGSKSVRRTEVSFLERGAEAACDVIVVFIIPGRVR